MRLLLLVVTFVGCVEPPQRPKPPLLVQPVERTTVFNRVRERRENVRRIKNEAAQAAAEQGRDLHAENWARFIDALTPDINFIW